MGRNPNIFAAGPHFWSVLLDAGSGRLLHHGNLRAPPKATFLPENEALLGDLSRTMMVSNHFFKVLVSWGVVWHFGGGPLIDSH